MSAIQTLHTTPSIDRTTPHTCAPHPLRSNQYGFMQNKMVFGRKNARADFIHSTAPPGRDGPVSVVCVSVYSLNIGKSLYMCVGVALFAGGR